MTLETDPAVEHSLALGRTVRQLREARGLTLRDVAALLGVSPATVSAIENGRTGISSQRIARLADGFGVPVQRLFLPAVHPTGNGRPVDAARGDFRTRPREAARAVVTMCTALPQWFRDTGPASPEHVAGQYVDFALDLVQCVASRPGHRTGTAGSSAAAP